MSELTNSKDVKDDVDSEGFGDWLVKLRRGEATEVTEFVTTYEPYVRRALRFRLKRAALQSVADSMDVCQSVLGGFLMRLAAGDYEIASVEELRGLLVAIAQKKFLHLNRRETAAKRNHLRNTPLEQLNELPERTESDPASIALIAELFEQAESRLSPKLLEVFRMRRKGFKWDEIVEKTGGDSSVLRKQLSRAIQQISQELGLGDEP
jgi:RNA polymerase sigma factor (sigma-70 family)